VILEYFFLSFINKEIYVICYSISMINTREDNYVLWKQI
jgi:hypothetical protein